MSRAARLAACAVIVATVVLSSPTPTRGYTLMASKWDNGTVTMHLKMGGGSGTLIDGTTSWNQVITNALATWNTHIDLVKFSAVNDSTATNGDGNSNNTIFFDATNYGEAFGESTLAVSTTWYIGSRKVESDVIFNTKFSWDSYRGNQRGGSSPVYDIFRVALHELGHTLGLDHPDENGQNVTALMNSLITNLDALATDDINGARALYGAGVTSNVSFPPRNETADFITRLGALYRDELRAAGVTTYVDAEGAGVWVPEYTRYRVGQCGHSDARSRVFLQITDGVAYGVCALTPSGPIPFPPRNEGLLFMIDLDALYRDTLGRTATTSFIDNEGIVVWVMEYLRYRLNGCSHEVATEKVFMQIRGLGIQPTC